MASATLTTALRQLHTLFNDGAAREQTDAQLLDRFVSRGDATAFEVLLARHGPMVLAVSRGVLKDPHEAEDALQATFLVMVRKARSIRGQAALGCWLHRVAYRVAVHANVESARRRREERSAAARRPESVTGREPGDSLRAALHEEVARLPERLRRPVVLCYFEGMSHAQAAFELRWGEATVRRRLAGARNLLRSRLSRRGVVVSAGMLALTLGRESLAAVPEAWAAASIRAMSEGLTRGVVGSMLMGRLGAVGAIILTAGTLIAASGLFSPSERTGLAARIRENAPAGETQPTDPAKALAPDGPPGDTVEIRGIVVDPDGKPVAGASLAIDVFKYKLWDGKGGEPTATSGPDGRFVLKSSREFFDRFSRGIDRRPARVVASAPGFGPGWAEPGARSDALKDVKLQLIKDDLPIKGRVLDLEGRPVAGAKIKTSSLLSPPGGDMSPWIEEMKAHAGSPYSGLDEMPLELTRTTDPDGRFRLEGIGRERLVMFTISGPTIELTRGFAMTKDVPDISAKNKNVIAPRTIIYHGARFDHVAAPSTPVVGAVRDRDTGKPLAGVRINAMPYDERSRAFYAEIASITDDQGRYRLTGLMKSDRYQLFAFPGDGQPYPTATFVMPARSAGLQPATIDLKLKRGALVRGRLTDKATGEPVQGSVESFSYRDNPNAKNYPDAQNTYAPRVFVQADGRFEIAALPGPGFIAASARSNRYLRGTGVETIKGMKEGQLLSALPSFVSPRDHNVFAEVMPDPEAGPFTRDLQVDPGRSVTGTIVDPDGKPASGVRVKGLTMEGYGTDRPLDSSAFEVTGIDPRHPRLVYFFQDDRKLAASLYIKGDETRPIEVRLQPWGVIAGRIVDDERQPRTKIELLSLMDPPGFDPNRGVLFDQNHVGPDGRFRIRLVPGLVYGAHVATEDNGVIGTAFEGVKVGPGEIKDLGDMKVKPPVRK
jgi:RNA polymerase sigma factor (sigma-70 family)